MINFVNPRGLSAGKMHGDLSSQAMSAKNGLQINDGVQYNEANPLTSRELRHPRRERKFHDF